ncbi:hypothetical protein [Mycolicibacterium aichiense]|uniref:Uncharacterized protein n=1 Tax=Mycolicibacterium aichiense TaxID=1799 RepID=A0AAD1HI45_9MYCO|nr:hypothetical protein [Mycolicibacterium aichiense]MCV7021189.1 hypothetical protein [Mycolicibacterium aichiense]BBX05767.1 hypothetical protein MAIC_05700 [Mycolicibacterium aichiense]STZ24890.1 Uncharacterised protein [Mycolicibacterium aichiense]
MKIAPAKTVGLVGAALLVGAAAVGCGSDDKGSESSSSSSSSSSSAASSSSSAASETSSAAAAAPAGDYSKLLLKASDIDPSFVASDPQINPNGVNGVVQSMTNPGKNETIVFAIVVSEDAAGALKALDSAKAELPKEVDGAPQPADVGDGGNGIIATGKSPDGTKAITEVYFTQGKSLVNIEFSSEPNDPVQNETALAIAKMQDTQVKNNLS